MRGQAVSEPGSGEDAGESGNHQKENTQGAVAAIAADEGQCAEGGDDDGEGTMRLLFRRQEVDRYGGERNDDRRGDAVNDAKSGCPDTEAVGGDGAQTAGNRG